jgi:hypothetical protein
MYRMMYCMMYYTSLNSADIRYYIRNVQPTFVPVSCPVSKVSEVVPAKAVIQAYRWSARVLLMTNLLLTHLYYHFIKLKHLLSHYHPHIQP